MLSGQGDLQDGRIKEEVGEPTAVTLQMWILCSKIRYTAVPSSTGPEGVDTLCHEMLPQWSPLDRPRQIQPWHYLRIYVLSVFCHINHRLNICLILAFRDGCCLQGQRKALHWLQVIHGDILHQSKDSKVQLLKTRACQLPTCDMIK